MILRPGIHFQWVGSLQGPWTDASRSVRACLRNNPESHINVSSWFIPLAPLVMSVSSASQLLPTVYPSDKTPAQLTKIPPFLVWIHQSDHSLGTLKRSTYGFQKSRAQALLLAIGLHAAWPSLGDSSRCAIYLFQDP